VLVVVLGLHWVAFGLSLAAWGWLSTELTGGHGQLGAPGFLEPLNGFRGSRHLSGTRTSILLLLVVSRLAERAAGHGVNLPDHGVNLPVHSLLF
jgi:hypothetical protein